MKELHNELHRHYALLLGVRSPWEVNGVKVDMAGKRVEIGLEWGQGHEVFCPECGRRCTLADHAPERTRRHLDTMQFETLIRARTPRSRLSAARGENRRGAVGGAGIPVHAAFRAVCD